MFMTTIQFVTAYCSGEYGNNEGRVLIPVPSTGRNLSSVVKN